MAKGHKGARRLFTICTNGSEAVLNIGGIDEKYHIGEGVKVSVDGDYPLWWRLVDSEVGKFSMGDDVIR